MNKVKIGFVGVGNMGQCAHLRNFVTVAECEVVALAEIRPKLARTVAQRYGVPKVYRDHEEMLAAEKLDGIVASQPFTRHGVLVPQLAKAGVPIMTEKPLAGSIAAGEQILKALADAGTWHMVGYHKRSDPATICARQQIDELKATGELGPMRYVRIVMPPGDWVAEGFTGLIRSDEKTGDLEWDPAPADMDEPTRNACNAFVNYYIHQVNLLRHLFAEPYRVSYADPSGVLLVAHSESGVAGVIEMATYQTTIAWEESALVGFEKGYVKLDLPAPLASNRPGSVEVYRDPGGGATPTRTIPTLPWVHAMRQQAINFIRAIKGEAKPPCEAPEALEDLKIAREYIRLLRGA